MAASVTIPGVRRSRLWFGLLGGAIAWLIHLIAASIIAEWGCMSGLYQREMLGLNAITWSLIAVSGVMLLIALAATWSAYGVNRLYRETSSHDHQDEEFGEHGTDIYMARVGLWSSALSTFIIMAQCVPIFFYLTEC